MLHTLLDWVLHLDTRLAALAARLGAAVAVAREQG
jgi:hypothetical protein